MKKKKWPMIVAAIIVIIVIAAVAGGKDDEPKKVSSDGQVQETGKTESTETQSQKFAVGDTAELKSVKVTLVSVTHSTRQRLKEVLHLLQKSLMEQLLLQPIRQQDFPIRV